jgi:hypothetical protein
MIIDPHALQVAAHVYRASLYDGLSASRISASSAPLLRRPLGDQGARFRKLLGEGCAVAAGQRHVMVFRGHWAAARLPW